jgi:acetyl-CoA C-acetyltransferase
MKLSDVVIVSAVRTPMGRFGGTLRNVASFDVGATVMRAVRERIDLAGDAVDEVIYGSCRQAGNGPNPARTASVRGGVDISVPVQTINMACPSGMITLIHAARGLQLGDFEVALTGGMDSMSTIPYLLKNARFEGFKMGDRTLEDGWSDSIDPLCGFGMGVTAENLVEKHDIPREDMDAFALASHKKAAAARDNGWFEPEIVPVEVPPASRKAEAVTFTTDETIRETTTVEKLGRLPAVFKKGGRVTAGNACGMSDGATALIVTTRERAAAEGWPVRFSIVSHATTAVAPETMGEGPGVAIPMALERASMTLADMDAYEVNEAFAAQVLTNELQLSWDRDKLNQHGGAIALGHPTGISGARILVTLDGVLRRIGGELGVASICGGGGVTTAMVVRRES